MRFVSNCFFLLFCHLLYSDDSVNSVNEEYVEEANTNIKEHVDSDIDEAFSVFPPDSAVDSQDNKLLENTVSKPTNTSPTSSNGAVDVSRDSARETERGAVNGGVSNDSTGLSTAGGNTSSLVATEDAGLGALEPKGNRVSTASVKVSHSLSVVEASVSDTVSGRGAVDALPESSRLSDKVGVSSSTRTESSGVGMAMVSSSSSVTPDGNSSKTASEGTSPYSGTTRVSAATGNSSSSEVTLSNGYGAGRAENPGDAAVITEAGAARDVHGGAASGNASSSKGALSSASTDSPESSVGGGSNASSVLTDTALIPKEDGLNLEGNKPISEMPENNGEDVMGNQNETEDAEFDSLFSSYSYEKVTQTTVQILNKISGECFNFPVKVGDVLVFKKLRIRVYNCFKTPPTEKLEHIGFIEIWEVQDLKPTLIHSGWMFSNHSVNIMQNPEYDVRIVN